MYFPPAGGGGVQRPLKLAQYLPALGIETHVLAPDDPKWVHRDPELRVPTQAWVHRARYLGLRAQKPKEELRAADGLERALVQAHATARRLLLPDASVTWNLTAIPAAIRIARREGIDAVITTSPPGSVHFVGAAVQRATGARWLADLRDPLVANPHRRSDTTAARARQATNERLARLVARRADAISCVSDAIAEEVRALGARGIVRTIANGCDFDDFAGLEYRPAAALPDHARGELLREARPAAVPAGAARLGRRRRRALRRRLPGLRPRVGRVARPRRPPPARPVRAARASRSASSATPRRCCCSCPTREAAGRACSPGRSSSTSPPAALSSRSCRPTAPRPSSSARRAPASSSRPTTSRGSPRRSATCTPASRTAACPRSSFPRTSATGFRGRPASRRRPTLLREIVVVTSHALAARLRFRDGASASSCSPSLDGLFLAAVLTVTFHKLQWELAGLAHALRRPDLGLPRALRLEPARARGRTAHAHGRRSRSRSCSRSRSSTSPATTRSTPARRSRSGRRGWSSSSSTSASSSPGSRSSPGGPWPSTG